MGTLSPALGHAFTLLRNDLYVHLDEADMLTLLDDEWETDETESARRLIRDLVQVVRSIVGGHEESTTGNCRFCRSKSWPCPTVEEVHRVLRDPDREFVRLVRAANSPDPE